MNLPSFDNPFYSEIVAGAKTSATRHGCHLLVNEEHINRSTMPRLVQLLHKTRAAGLITLNHIPTDMLRKLSSMIPLVQCCEFGQELDLPYVSIDDFAASRHVTEYMLSLGKKRVAIISGPPRYKYARFDNIEFSSMVIPSITTVSQPESQLGFMACELLLEKIATPSIPNKKILLETEFIVRESTSGPISNVRDWMPAF